MPEKEPLKPVIQSHPSTQILAETTARLHVKNRVLERLLHLFSDLGQPDKVRAEILNAALDAMPSEAASLILVNPENGEMTFVETRGPVADKIRGLKLGAGKGIAGACVIEKKSLAVSDVTRDPRYAEDIARALGFKTHSLLAVPVIWKGDAIAVIEMVNKNAGHVYDRQEIDLMERIARSAATLLHLTGARA